MASSLRPLLMSIDPRLFRTMKLSLVTRTV